jgi:ATP-binding cassette, subfamily B, multidrug efflux pump
MSAAAQTLPATAAAPAAAPKPVSGWRHTLRLLPYVRRHTGMVFLGMVMQAGMGVAGTILPVVIGVVIDCVQGAAQPMAQLGRLGQWMLYILPAYRPRTVHTVIAFCIAMLAVVAIKGVFSFWTRWILIGLSRDVEYDLRNDLLDSLVKMEPEYYVRNRTGELMSRCTNDLNSVRMVLGPGIMYSANTLATMVLALILMFWLSPRLSIYVLLPVPVVAFVVFYFGRQIHGLYGKIQASLASLSSRAQENLAGVRVIRAYAQEEAEIKGFDEPNREYIERNLRLIYFWSLFMPALQTLIGFTFLLVLWQGGRLVMLNRISLGELIVFYNFMLQLVFPMIALGFVTNIWQRGAASMGRLNYILDAKPSIDDRAAVHEPAQEIRGEIELRHLNFRYPTMSPAGDRAAAAPTNGDADGRRSDATLEDVTLEVPAGSTLAVVGPTGSGKSTVAALLARLWEAPDGTLYLDGRPVRQWPLGELRHAVGFVPQDAFLFSKTIGENIAFGVEHASPDQIRQAADIAGIASEVEDFPLGYDTLLGERGITVSGGQKQRIALARAVIRDPKILVLDDALSSVDTDTEDRILRRLREFMRGRTTILISHRCSTVRHADQIAVLHRGRVVELGTHDELIERNGYYADLYQKQLLEEELERA